MSALPPPTEELQRDDSPGNFTALGVGAVFGLAVIALIAVLRFADAIEAWLS